MTVITTMDVECSGAQYAPEYVMMNSSPPLRLAESLQSLGPDCRGGAERPEWASRVSSITVCSREADNSARELHSVYKMFCT